MCLVLSDYGISFIIFLEEESNGDHVCQMEFRVVMWEFLFVTEEMKILNAEQLGLSIAIDLGVFT